MANIRKLLLWKTSLKGISNTEATPDLHVAPAPVRYNRDSSTLEPINFAVYSGGGYDTEGDSGYYFAKSAVVNNPGGESVGEVTYAIVDPTELARKTYSLWEIYGEPSYEAQDKFPDPYPKIDGYSYDTYLENWSFPQPYSSGFEGQYNSTYSWGNLYAQNLYQDLTIPSLNQRFFTAGFIQPLVEDPNHDSIYYSDCVWPLQDGTVTSYLDPWVQHSVNAGSVPSSTRGFNWKYRWLDQDGTLGWTNSTYSGTKWDMYRFTKTVPNTVSLSANYWLTSYYTDTPGVWNEFDGATLTTGEIPGWELWNEGSADSVDVYGEFDVETLNRNELVKHSINAGLSKTFSDQGDSINIGFEIELALFRIGATIEKGFGTDDGGGNLGNLLTYRAGNFTFSHPNSVAAADYSTDEIDSSAAGSHIYIPVYAQFEAQNRNQGKIPTILPEPLARYLVVALRLRQKYNINTIIPGSGIVLDASLRSSGERYAFHAPSVSGYYHGNGSSFSRPWDAYGSFPSTRLYFEGRESNAYAAPVTCYRLSEDGRYHFISGGTRAPQQHNLQSRSQCITRFVIGHDGLANAGNDRSKAFAGPTQYDTGGYATDDWGFAAYQAIHWYYNETSSDERQDQHTLIVPNCPKFAGYVANDGRTDTAYVPSDYDGYRISCFRFSNDARFMYVMWDNAGEDGRKSNTGSNTINCFIERYYCSRPIKTGDTEDSGWYPAFTPSSTEPVTMGGVHWCGTSGITQILADPLKTESPYIYPPSSFEITPDGQYCQVMLDPFREGKPVITEHWLGGDDMKTINDSNGILPTSPEYTFANYDSSQPDPWTKKIYWPQNNFAPGVTDPQPFYSNGQSRVRSVGSQGHTSIQGCRTFIMLGWSWVNQYEYVTQTSHSEISNRPTIRREVNTYPCDFEWSVDGTVLYLFQRYQDADYGSRLSGSDRGMMELDNQPVMFSVCMNMWDKGTYKKYPYTYPNDNDANPSQSRGSTFLYAHRIYGISRETKDRYISTGDTSNIAYTAYWPVRYKTNLTNNSTNELYDAIRFAPQIASYANQDSSVIFEAISMRPQRRTGTFRTDNVADGNIYSLDPNADTTNWTYYPPNANFTRNRNLRAQQHIVVGRGDNPDSLSVFYNDFTYEFSFAHGTFSGRTIHITDAAGNDLSGKEGVTITGTPGSDYLMTLKFNESATAAPGRLVDYNPVYIRVDGNTSNLGFKVYHETPTPIQQIALPLVAVDNPGPERPGSWATARDDYFAFTLSYLIPGNNLYNQYGYQNAGLTSKHLYTKEDAAVYNISKNGCFLNFMGTVELNGWDGGTPARANLNRRIYTHMLNSEREDHYEKFFSLEYYAGTVNTAYELGNQYDGLIFDDNGVSGRYQYFDNGTNNGKTDFIMQGPWNGRTEYGNTMKLTELNGYSSWSIPNLEGPPLQGYANNAILFDLTLDRSWLDRYQVEGESLAHGITYRNQYRPSTTRSYSYFNVQSSAGAYFSRQPQGYLLSWPEDVQSLGDSRDTMKASIVGDRRGGKSGYWFVLDDVYSSGFIWNGTLRNEHGFSRGEDPNLITRGSDTYVFGGGYQPKKNVLSPLLNGTFLTNGWTTLNNIFNVWDLPPWRLNKSSMDSSAGADGNQSSGYILSFMDLEAGSNNSNNRFRQYSVKRKKFEGLNLTTAAYSYAQQAPFNAVDEWVGYSVTIPEAAADGFQSYASVNGDPVDLYGVDVENQVLNSRRVWSIRSVKYVDDGKRLAVLASGQVRQVGFNIISKPGWTVYLYDLPNPYSLKDAVYDKAFTYYFNGTFQQNNWWNSNGGGIYQQYGCDFVFKDDGTKFWVIGIESNAPSFGPTRNTNIQTNLYEYSISSAWDLSTASYSNQTVYDNLSYDSSYDYEVPCDLTTSKDGSTVYWSTYNPLRNTSFEDTHGIRMNHFRSPLSQNWNLLSPTTQTTTPVQITGFSGNRIQVGTKWYAKEGAGQKVRFINDERWYRTNAASNKDGTPDTALYFYFNGQNWPSGGASSFDVDRSTQKEAGSFSFGNMGMFPMVERDGVGPGDASSNNRVSSRENSCGADIFSFDISPIENRAIICDGQITVYELKFNNDTKGFG